MVDPPDAEEEGRSKEPGPDCSAATASAAAATGAPSPQIRNGPDPASEPSLPGRQREQSPKLHLDLFNFDSPEAEGSRYVLTSPRSLEACARCGVKPIVLLQRSVNDFAKEAPGESMQVAEGLFEVYERERQGKLRECREERERIIKEEKRRISNSVSSSLPCSPAAQPKKKGKCRSLDSKPKKREPCHSTTTSTTMRTSSESGASSFSWDSPRDSTDKWPKASSPRVRTVASLNSLMGRSLSLGDLSHSPQTTKRVERIVKDVKRRGLSEVPERDRKIAALMLAKHQEEHIMSQSRYMAHLQWDSERRLEELSREREEREKQRAVLQCQRIWHTQVSSRQRQLSQEQKEMATIKQRQAEESEEKWRELAERQKQSRQDRLRQTAGEEKQKKSHQEHNLKALEEERRAILEQEQQLLQDKLTMAELRKQEREHQQQKELRGLNKAEKLRHKALIREIVRREAEERKLAKRTMEDKLSRSMENYEQIQERRNQELREKAKKEEQHIKKAQQAAEKKEKEQREHLESLARESERRAQQAAQVAEERAQQKALKAVQSRLEKEKIQRLNRQRVEEEEQQRRQELLMSIEKKLEKSEQIFREKRAVLESARSMARASFHVRDRVRDETNMRTFDKMALEAQLQASLIEK
ncbi:CC177 protein, partial [Polyodon spathula]|nr:CC177 protein [Polyodon spathula]